MWDVAAGPYLAAAGLLVVAGVPKVADPLPLVRALRAAGMPLPRLLVRAFATAEVAVGLWALAAPGRASSGLVAAAYLLFTAFVARALARGGILGSCGCFGKADTPATRTHLTLTAAAALVGAWATVDPPRGVWSGVDATTLTTVGLGAVVAFLGWQAMAVLPTTTAAAVRSTTKG